MQGGQEGAITGIVLKFSMIDLNEALTFNLYYDLAFSVS